MEGEALKTQDTVRKTQDADALLMEVIAVELAAAAHAAREVQQRLVVVQKALRDVPLVITVDDVTALYAASHTADTLEQSLRSLRAHVYSDTDETA